VSLGKQPARSGDILKLIYEHGGSAEVEILDDRTGIKEHGEQDSFFRKFRKGLLFIQVVSSVALTLVIGALTLVLHFTTFQGSRSLLLILTITLILWIIIPLARGIGGSHHAVDLLSYLAAFALLGMSIYNTLTRKPGIFYFDAALIFTLLLLVRFFEERVNQQSNQLIKALLSYIPKKTKKIFPDGGGVYVDVKTIQEGDEVQVKSQDRIPCDGEVTAGNSTVDESFLAGESLPKEKGIGSFVYAGSLNQSGTIVVRVKNPLGKTVLEDIVGSLSLSQTTFSHIQKRLNILSWVILPFVALIATGAFFGWFATGFSLFDALRVSLSVLLAVAPFSFRIVTPIVYAITLQKAAARGILFHRISNIEHLPRANVSLFPYLGVITKGKPEVTDILGGDRFKIIQMAGSLEQKVDNLLGRAVVAKADAEGVTLSRHTKDNYFEAHNGVSGIIDGRLLALGSQKFAEDFGANIEPFRETISDLESQGKMVLVLCTKKEVLGVLGLTDEKRDDIKGVIQNLSKLSVKSYVVTSQNKNALQVQSRLLGVAGSISEPDESRRNAAIRALAKKKNLVLAVHELESKEMFSEAHIHALLHTKNVRDETDAIVFVRPFLSRLPELFRLALSASSIIQQNLAFVMLYSVIITVLALLDIIRPAESAALSTLSVLFVLWHSTRAKNDPRR
jgi:Cu+-exporting ATPase